MAARRFVSRYLRMPGRIRVRDVNGPSYLLFISKPSGYELREEAGDPPAVGSEVEADSMKLRVTKIAPSPLPNDPRLCAYVQAT
jgi:hypothetical protein